MDAQRIQHMAEEAIQEALNIITHFLGRVTVEGVDGPVLCVDEDALRASCERAGVALHEVFLPVKAFVVIDSQFRERVHAPSEYAGTPGEAFQRFKWLDNTFRKRLEQGLDSCQLAAIGYEVADGIADGVYLDGTDSELIETHYTHTLAPSSETGGTYSTLPPSAGKAPMAESSNDQRPGGVAAIPEVEEEHADEPADDFQATFNRELADLLVLFPESHHTVVYHEDTQTVEFDFGGVPVGFDPARDGLAGYIVPMMIPQMNRSRVMRAVRGFVFRAHDKADWSRFIAEGVQILALYVRTMPYVCAPVTNVERITVSCNLTDEACAAIVRAVPDILPNLTSLDLNHNQLGALHNAARAEAWRAGAAWA